MSQLAANTTEDLVQWSDELSVGIEEIDNQHRILVDLLNELHRAIVEHRGSEAAHRILAELLEYTRIHFAVEESLMRILGYPDYEEHKHHHELLINEVQELSQKLEAGKKSVNFELLHFLKMWLTKHIMEEDRQYTSHFLAKGVQQSYEKRSWVGKFWDSLHHK
ncbi:MAG: bacteriohemerythrin [Thiohalophilus sp.]|uniref:bacteriohemerythrin n=1 Tax=Thiohalophilus sp. TaxID=3028392 RepID=UPI00286FD333|nr:bacteriohemerythrin [Thiohalophilus sp.]MDR9435650.1 bacteriohemerythrin [Thiohalophilus sp.]